MNDDKEPIVGPTIDYSEIPSIHQKRTISFINHFIVTTVTFLNKFSLNCEGRLFEFENKLQKLEAAIVILESRLGSVPCLRSADTNVKDHHEKLDKLGSDLETANIHTITDSIVQQMPIQLQTLNVELIDKHAPYEKYFKMVNVGVPKLAVKMKMTQEGLDPTFLDVPYDHFSRHPV